MTYRRVLARNGLTKGDYSTNVWKRGPWPERSEFNADVDYDAACRRQVDEAWEMVGRIEQAKSALLGDLRRLEDDAVDEKAICQFISETTHVERDIVAAVIKEFIAQ